MTPPEYGSVEHDEPLQAIDEKGAAESSEISWAWVASMFPALSQARYLTVVVVSTEKGPE